MPHIITEAWAVTAFQWPLFTVPCSIVLSMYFTTTRTTRNLIPFVNDGPTTKTQESHQSHSPPWRGNEKATQYETIFQRRPNAPNCRNLCKWAWYRPKNGVSGRKGRYKMQATHGWAFQTHARYEIPVNGVRGMVGGKIRSTPREPVSIRPSCQPWPLQTLHPRAVSSWYFSSSRLVHVWAKVASNWTRGWNSRDFTGANLYATKIPTLPWSWSK